MNSLKLCALMGLIISANSLALDSYQNSFEDTWEFLQPGYPAKSELDSSRPETWAHYFEFITPNGKSKIISKANADMLLKPASTLKLFTGWWSFKEKTRTPLYLGQMLKKSDNQMAEETLQDMGGVLSMQDWFVNKGLALDPVNFVAVDGSGLSYDNQSSCKIQIELLRKIKKDPTHKKFQQLLAQPRVTSTLETRLTQFAGRLFAKTGTLRHTAALTGFIETRKGTLMFCVLADYLRTSLPSARQKIDKLVTNQYNRAINAQ
jgi:D-alanyl-D-alanine carboxypeptidase